MLNSQEYVMNYLSTDDIGHIDSESERSMNRDHSHSYAYFSDGCRRVDYVLVYQEIDENNDDERITACCSGNETVPELMLMVSDRHDESRRREARHIFEDNLRRKGLQLEDVPGKFCKGLRFVLVHAPFELLTTQAEKLGIEMPVKSSTYKLRTVIKGPLDKLLEQCEFFFFDDEIEELMKAPLYQNALFTKDCLDCFVGSEDEEEFFTSAERVMIVHDILSRARFGEGDLIGIECILSREVYTAAYPLHEYLDYENLRPGVCSCEPRKTAAELKTATTRQLLYWTWTKFQYFYKFQPLYLIKKYFGSKIGMYFILLGYYTKYLIPTSAIGVLCFYYGLLSLHADIPSNEICGREPASVGSVLMCPTCDFWCDFTLLSSSCFLSKLSYVFDNISTFIYAVLMSVGATLFVEGWKRYNAETAWKLGLLDTGVQEEGIRLAYLLQSQRLGKPHRDPLTHRVQPVYIPLSKRLPTILASGVTVLFFLCIIMAVVVGTIVYRTVMMQVLYRVDRMKPFAAIFTSVTTSAINLIVCILLSYFYGYLALKLTDWEYPMTQSEFEKSYTMKVFLFQFINYYSSIFYVAFFKGNFSSLPGRSIFGLRPEDCDPSGCMVELVILLATIFFGKLIYNGLLEFFNPALMSFFRGMTLNIPEMRNQKFEQFRQTKRKEMQLVRERVPRWEWDYALTPNYQQTLFDEYLDIVLQFGFVTLFVSAFPLAPLFALLNNLLEGRVDAYRVVTTNRRPVPERARNLGVWLPIIDWISKAAVLTNAFVIAFTSEFIPKFVYIHQFHHQDLTGYVNSTLSVFDCTGLHVPEWSHWVNTSTCRFRDYRKPPCSSFTSNSQCSGSYGVTEEWWIVLAFRLGFVVIFAVSVLAVKSFIAYIIPDIPSRVYIQMRRQRSLSLDRISIDNNQRTYTM